MEIKSLLNNKWRIAFLFVFFVIICLFSSLDYAFADDENTNVDINNKILSPGFAPLDEKYINTATKHEFYREPICVIDNNFKKDTYYVPLSKGQTLWSGIQENSIENMDPYNLNSGFTDIVDTTKLDYDKEPQAGGFYRYPWDGYYASKDGVIQGGAFGDANVIHKLQTLKAKKNSHILYFYCSDDNFWINSMAVQQNGAPSVQLCYGHDSYFDVLSSHYILTFDLYRFNPKNNQLEISTYKYDLNDAVDTDCGTKSIDFNDDTWVDMDGKLGPESVDKTPGNLYQIIKNGGYIALTNVECVHRNMPDVWNTEAKKMEWKIVDGPSIPDEGV